MGLAKVPTITNTHICRIYLLVSASCLRPRFWNRCPGQCELWKMGQNLVFSQDSPGTSRFPLRPRNYPVLLRNGSHLDAPLPRPVVAVEAHGSRHPCVAESPQRRSRLLSEPNLRDGATAQAFRRASVLIRRGNRRSASRTACLAAFIEQTGESRSGVASVGPLARSDRDR